MSAPHYDGPKDFTNPLLYIPVAIIAVGFVAFVFATGFLRGAYTGRLSDPPEVEDPQAAAAAAVNVRALAEATPDLIRTGRQVYALNCASCHGEDGDGRGSSGRGLNPPPHNFRNPGEEWTKGPEIAAMWDTLQNGIAGTSMVNYRNTLTPEQRIAVIHFIREEWLQEIDQYVPLRDEDLAALPAGGTQQAAGGDDFEEVDTGPRIPVRLAMNKMAADTRGTGGEVSLPGHVRDLPGAALFGANCASCHGPDGQGMESVRVLSIFPYIRVSTEPLLGAEGSWVDSADAFRRLMTDTSGGEAYHRFSTLTRRQMDDLHEYVRALATEGTLREVAYDAR